MTTTDLVPLPIVGVAMMDAIEARETLARMAGDLERAEDSLSSFRQRALDFADRQGWAALGYAGAAEAINAELGAQYSKSYLSRLLGAARVERLLELPTGNSVPERALREIGRLDDPADQRAAWQAATTAAGGVPSSAQVAAAVAERRGDETPHDLRRAGVQLVRHGAWYQPVGFSGQMNGWVGDAAPKADAIRAAWAEIKRRLNAPKRAATPGFTPTPQVAAPLPPLPPLPDPLCYTWTHWRNEDGQIGMRHVSGYTFAGTDLGEIEDLARHLSRPLAELYDHAWRVSYDPGAEGHADLHAYTGTHEAFDAISAPTIQQLALAAWWARQAVDDVPNMPDDVIDALWLAGYDWSGTAWVRGFERIEEDANLNELRYQLGLTSAAPVADVPHLPDGWADATARANRLGLYLGMNMAGVFSLSNLSGSVVSRIESWPDVLALLLELKEAAATRAAPAAKALDWRAVARLTAKLGGGQDTDPAATYRAIGMLLAAGGVLPALPTRPRAPRSADVSEQLAYLGQLETYVEALERRAGVRE